MLPHRTRACHWTIVAALAGCWNAARAESPVVSFRNEVMAVLSRAGCNQGACHGNQNGKNGFKLSLRGEDPAFDLAALTRDQFGRRTDSLRPSESLMLLKATASIPHEGGKRFDVRSPEYAILLNWIAQGRNTDGPGTPRVVGLEVRPADAVLLEPAGAVSIHVRARFSDNTQRDVTQLAVFESSNPVVNVRPDGQVEHQQPGEATIQVRYLDQRATVQLAFVPARPHFAWKTVAEANDIDHHVFAKLRALRMTPSAPCSDTLFLRRAYLDVLGVLPTPAEVRGFLKDPHPDKRARLIDQLLARPEFADFWALKWSDLLRNEEKVLDRKGVEVFHHWIRDWIAQGKPLNEFARQLIAARGSTYSNPPANYYRALRDAQARAEATAQVFLGVRLQCARCHNHPYDHWTQNDYYGLAACFAPVQYKILENRRRDRFDKHEFDGEQVVWMDRAGAVKHPRTGQTMPPHVPGAPADQLLQGDDRLQALADWVARPDNPYFARGQVNRIWFHLLGRGIVEPDDDFRASNPPVNGPLLEWLARDFAEHNFDLRHTIRQIMNSRTYQLAAAPNDTNGEDESNFSHALVRPMQAEQLLDALSQVTAVPVKFNGYPLGMRAGQIPGVRQGRERGQRPTEGELFLAQFGKPERLLSCECERSSDTTVGQTLQLLTGPLIQHLLEAPDNRIGRMLAQGSSTCQIAEELYLAALCRFPTQTEARAICSYVAKAKDRRAALEDAAWAVLNAKEFLLRQ